VSGHTATGPDDPPARDAKPSAARGRRARKRGNGEGTIFKRADGRYTAGIFVNRPDGTRSRKWIYGRTRAEVAAALAGLAQRVEAGAVVPTRSPNLSEYLTYWLTDVITPSRRPTTVRSTGPRSSSTCDQAWDITGSTNSPSPSFSATSTVDAPLATRSRSWK